MKPSAADNAVAAHKIYIDALAAHEVSRAVLIAAKTVYEASVYAIDARNASDALTARNAGTA